MPTPNSSCETTAETLVRQALRASSSLTMDELVTRLPELRWNEVFDVVDRLSRQGAIVLRRLGFEYDLRLAQALTYPTSMAS